LIKYRYNGLSLRPSETGCPRVLELDVVPANQSSNNALLLLPPDHILTTAELVNAVAQNTSTETLARLHQTIQELNATFTWRIGRVPDLTQHHKSVSEHDYGGADLIGRDEYLAATTTAGPALHLMLSIPRGYWYLLFEENTLRPIAAMMVQMPAPSPQQ